MNASFDRILNDAFNTETPISATIELTTLCNWKCKHCYINFHDEKGLSELKVKELLRDLRELGVHQLVLTGGEIFIRKDILRIIKYAKELHFRVNILSNASLITEEVAKELSNLYITDYSLTIFSLDEDIHDNITGVKGSLRAALKGVELLKKYNVPVELKTPILSENYTDFIDIKAFCDKEGFSFITSPSIFPKIDGDKSPLQYFLTDQQLEEIIRQVDNSINYKILQEIPEYMCGTLRHSLFVASNGKVYPCNGFYVEVGNIYDMSIKEIWNLPNYYQLRNLKNNNTSECMKCELFSFCERCPGTVFSENEDVYGCSAICKSIAIARNNNYN